MEVTLIDQISNFFFSVIFGAILGIILDIFKIIGVIFRFSEKKIFWRDIIYFSLIGVLSFLFIVAVNMGELRVYIIAGELVGWIIYHFTLGNKVVKKATLIINFFKKSFLKILLMLPKPKKPEFYKIKKCHKKCSTFLFSTLKKIKIH
ncbi:MAG: hypothetical protein RUMPE_00833 [Eubacteriales bacterium SKADARSKE-1]|nr:hypothetical protein [Eubacteriales bacterium SKADARSKE-1]